MSRFQKVILTDVLKNLAQFKNDEKILIVPTAPHVLWELREAGFYNVRDLRDHGAQKPNDYDDLYRIYAPLCEAVFKAKQEESWKCLGQEIMTLWAPICYIKERIQSLISGGVVISEIEIRIHNPYDRFLFEEALNLLR